MKILISFYDNVLIYYPNLFFAVLFFVSILGIVLFAIGIVVFERAVEKFIKTIRNRLNQKKIKERKKFFSVRMARVVFIRINTSLGYIESQIEKIIKKIEKEILIKE